MVFGADPQNSDNTDHMSKLILHVGTHKTGTTTFQAFLYEQRTALLSHGFHHAEFDRGLRSHNQFAHRIATCDDRQLKVLKDAVRKNSIPGCVTIISSEELSVRTRDTQHWYGFDHSDYAHRRQEYLNRLTYLFSDYKEIEIYMCVRRHDEYAEALYATNLITGAVTCSFEEFIVRCVPIFDYSRKVAEFHEVASGIALLSFDVLKKDLIANYTEWMKLPILPYERAQKNPTPDAELVQWLYLHARKGCTFAEQRVRGNFIKTCSRTWLTADQKAQKTSLWPSRKAREAFVRANTVPGGIQFSDEYPEREQVSLTTSEIEILDEAFDRWRKNIPISHKIKTRIRRLFRHS
jgi:hypothetical protein